MTAIRSEHAARHGSEGAHLCHITPAPQPTLFPHARRVYRRLTIQPINPPTAMPNAKVAAMVSTG